MIVEGSVERRRDLSAAEFQEHVRGGGGPLILAGAMQGWRAMSAWSNDYLRGRCAGRPLRVVMEDEGHNRYDRAKPTYMDAGEYIDIIASGGDAARRSSAVQVSMLESLPALLEDIAFPAAIDARNVVSLNYWMAAARTVTHLHWDGNPGLLAIVRGRKRMTLFSPDQLDRFYPVPSAEPWLIWSQVDVFSPDLGRFPRFKEARGVEAMVEAGDILYVPSHWWHFVENLETAIGVQFWLVPADDLAREVEGGITFYDDRSRIAKLRPRK